MTDVKSLFSSRFAHFVVETYAPLLRSAAPGHCLKLVGLALRDLRQIVGPLRAVNMNVGVFILSDEEAGPEFVRASKLIEMRNDSSRALLALIPANSRTAAEDSYGDSTFQVLDAASLLKPFFESLEEAARGVNESLYERTANLLRQYLGPSPALMADYLLFVEGAGYAAPAWGDGLFLFGMLPDGKFATVDAEEANRRFLVNLQQCADVMFNFSVTPAERVAALRIDDTSLQSDILRYLIGSAKADRLAMCADIYENHPEFNLSHWPIERTSESTPVKLSVALKAGADRTKELVRDSCGDFLLAFPAPDERGRSKPTKRKVTVEVTAEPSPKDEPAIAFYEVTLVKFRDFEEIGLVKNVPVGSSRKAKKKLSVSIEADDGIEEDQYLLRVRALDSNKLPLKSDNPFKSESVEQKWREMGENDPERKESFRRSESVLFSNETELFSIVKGDDDIELGSPAKRNWADALFLAQIDRDIQFLAKGAEPTANEPANINAWAGAKPCDTIQFDFGASSYYKLSVPCKLKEIEKCFYSTTGMVGRVSAVLSADKHMAELLDLTFHGIESGEDSYVRLCGLRQKLFSLIRGSVGEEGGLFCTFDVWANIDLVREYLAAYAAWLSDAATAADEPASSTALLNADIVSLDVEMPDGRRMPVRLIPPIHPLRLAWAACLCELFSDWRARSANGGYSDAREWKNRLAPLFRGGLPPDVAPLVLADCSRRSRLFKYSGEVAFGWGLYNLADDWLAESPFSDSRQIMAYVGSLLNVGRRTGFDSDMDADLVAEQIKRYVATHPYADKLVLNIFNAGDGGVFADALVGLQDDCGADLSYEVRLFSAESFVKPGAAFRYLLDPESPVSELAAPFALQPKLRFSVNPIDDFIERPADYPAHMSFLVNPFRTKVAIVSPGRERRSFFLNGALCRGLSSARGNNSSFVWDRYFSNMEVRGALSGAAASEVGIFASLQSLAASHVSSTPGGALPASSLIMTGREAMLVDKVHDVSDWVVTFDKNMGPEFYDRREDGEFSEPDADSVKAEPDHVRMPYLLDFVPGCDTCRPSAFISSRAEDEIMSVLRSDASRAGLELGQSEGYALIEDVRAVSASALFPSGGDKETDRRPLPLALALAKRLLQRMSVLDEAFLIPLNLHENLFPADEPVANMLLVNMNPESRHVHLTVIDARCGKCASEADKVWPGMPERLEGAVAALSSLFAAGDAPERLGCEIEGLAVSDLLSFYLSRAIRFDLLNKDVADLYLDMVDSLDEGYSLSFSKIALAFNSGQMERVGHAPVGDGHFFSFGMPALCDLLSDDAEASANIGEAVPSLYDLFDHKLGELVNFRLAEVERNAKAVASAAAVESGTGKPAVATAAPSIPEPLAAPAPEASVQSAGTLLDNTSRAESPQCGLMLGGSARVSPQFAVVGRVVSDGGALAGLDFSSGNAISIFGVHDSGSDGSFAAIVESALQPACAQSAPLAGVVFCFSPDPDSVPPFASMLSPNADAAQVSRLRTEFSMEPVGLSDVVLLTPKNLVESRRGDYPGLEVRPLAFASKELGVEDWMWILGAKGPDSAYAKQARQVLKACRRNMTLAEIEKAVEADASIAQAHKSALMQRLDSVADYVDDSAPVSDALRPGRLVVVDLCDEFIDESDVLSLFVAMTGVFSRVNPSERINKLMAFAEANKYMSCPDLAPAWAAAVDDVRRKGVSVLISSHSPASLPTAVVEVSSVVVLHRLIQPSWLEALQTALEPLRRLSPSDVARLASGEAYVWAGTAAGDSAASLPARIAMRPPRSAVK